MIKTHGNKLLPGWSILFLKKKEGKKAEVGDGLQVHLIYKNESDSVLFDSKTMGDEFTLELTESPFEGSLEEGFAMLGEGDSAAFLIVADSVYKNVFHQPLPPGTPKGSKMRIDVRLNKVLTPREYKSYINQNEKAEVIDEDTQIRMYMANNQISAAPDENGLYFISFVDGSGKQPQPGDSVEVSYLVRSLSGELFDQSDKGYKFKMGDSIMVAGWNLGIAKMKEDGKARFIIPSKLGYGTSGNGKVPPGTPLVFDIDLINVK